MDVLNKLKNTVSSTVSQLSGVLPGNPVTREYEVSGHIASAGPGLLWKIYGGCKKSTKQEASIFVFEKKVLERYSRRDKEIILENLKRGVSQLTRLRHPRILTVQHPLEESRESLAFATEPVFASLANVLGQQDNMPSPLPTELIDYQLYDVEIKYGLLQLSESLAFLHTDVKMLHRNICPEAVIINKAGAWKVAGFEFSLMNSNPVEQQPYWKFVELDPEIHMFAQPNLDYLAPEYALTSTCDTASDMFSLGCLIYSIYNQGKPLSGNNGNLSTFKKNAYELKSLPSNVLNSVPVEIRDYLKMLLSITPEVRPDAHQFSKIQFFEDVGAKTLQYLDSLFQWDNLQKSQFYKGLPQVIANLPKRVNLHRILPCLVKEFPNVEMIPFVLPNVLLIAEDTSKTEFCQYILPELKPVFKHQEPIQILLIFLQKMELLLTKTPADDIRNHILPLVYSSLESNVQQIQELCLNIIPDFASLVEYPAMKNALMPRIKKLCLSTPYLSVRVNCLICIGRLLDHLDKWLVLDEILPFLPEIPSKEPAVLMGILGIYKLTLSHKKLGITKEIMATKVIPFLMPLCIENGLTLKQFNAIISLLKDMIAQVESEHRAKLEQLNSIQQEQRSALEMGKIQTPKKDELVSGLQIKAMDNMFQGLGLDSYLEEKDITKTAAALLSPTSGNPPQNTPSTNKVSLTLEEKQRLIKEQELQQRLKSQTPLKPQTNPVNRSAPKDLTDTLINSNLMSMASPKPSTNVPSYNFVGNYSSPSFNYSPSPTIPNYQLAMPNNVPSPGMMGAVVPRYPVGPMPLQMNNPMSTGWNVSPMSFAPKQQTVPLSKPDMSAFDNLLQTSNQSKVSLNQMATQKIAGSQGNGTKEQKSPPGAHSDLSDLLG